MRTHISRNIRSPLHIPQATDRFDGLKAIAMTWNPGKRSDSSRDMEIQFITLDPHLVAHAKQAWGEVALWLISWAKS
jgi:hypothetical protein